MTSCCMSESPSDRFWIQLYVDIQVDWSGGSPNRLWGVTHNGSTVNPEYFVRIQFSYPGLSDLSYAWNFRSVADRCRFSGMLCTFRIHFIFVRKAARTKYTKITCIRNILDLQYYVECTTLAQKKNHPWDSRREERYSIVWYHAWWRTISAGQKSRMTLPCVDRASSSMISQDRTAFFSPRISRMVLFLARVVDDVLVWAV